MAIRIANHRVQYQVPSDSLLGLFSGFFFLEDSIERIPDVLERMIGLAKPDVRIIAHDGPLQNLVSVNELLVFGDEGLDSYLP